MVKVLATCFGRTWSDVVLNDRLVLGRPWLLDFISEVLLHAVSELQIGGRDARFEKVRFFSLGTQSTEIK